MLLHDAQDSIPFLRSEPAAPGEGKIVHPNLRGRLGLIDMDVRRLVRLMAVEVEAIAVDSQDRGHALNLAMAHGLTKSGYANYGLSFPRCLARAWHVAGTSASGGAEGVWMEACCFQSLMTATDARKAC